MDPPTKVHDQNSQLPEGVQVGAADVTLVGGPAEAPRSGRLATTSSKAAQSSEPVSRALEASSDPSRLSSDPRSVCGSTAREGSPSPARADPQPWPPRRAPPGPEPLGTVGGESPRRDRIGPPKKRDVASRSPETPRTSLGRFLPRSTRWSGVSCLAGVVRTTSTPEGSRLFTK